MRLELVQPIEGVLRQGHPWIYADAVRQRGRPATAGSAVEVVDAQGDFVGRAIFDPGSPLRARIWTRDPDVRVDEALLRERIKAARRRRPFPTPQTTGYRLLHGEGDRTPGLVCDIYGEVAVLRPDGLAAERWLEPARRIIGELLGIERWAVRRSSIHARQGAPESHWWGRESDRAQADGAVEFLEDGIRYQCDVIRGQKTGFFLDQRANRARVARHSAGRRVLNLFGYTGGFSVAAAMHGAAMTTTVDLASPAIEAARRHFELNGLPPQAHAFEVADVFDYLERFDPHSAPFEVAICDPPSFAHRRRDVPRAEEAYLRLFGRLLEVMPRGARVALSSCSSHIGRDDFLDICARAAQQAGASLVLDGIWGADLDHPILPGFPEGDYLQCVIGTSQPL